jgi:MFS family permease
LISIRALGDVFRNPELRRLQLAWAGISFATWAFAIALGIYAFAAAGPAAVGIAGRVRVLPGALASPFGGLLGDRHSRRAVLMWSAFGSTVVLALAALAVAAGAPTWLTFALAGLFTVCTSPYIPAESALLPRLARTPAELSAANVTHSLMDNVGFLGGSIITGLLLAFVSVEVVFGIAALAAGASLAAIAAMEADRRPDYAGQGDAGSILRQTSAGVRAVLYEPPLRLLGGCIALLAFVEGAADVLAVLVALDLLGLGDSAVGYINAAWGIGAVVAGAALAVVIDRGHLVAALVIGCLLMGTAMALPGIWPVVLAASVAWFGLGFGFEFVEVASSTLVQRLGDDEILARTRGSLETGRLLAMALGAVVVSPLVELFGIRVAAIALAAVMPLFALLRWNRLRSYEVGAPVSAHQFTLLRGDPIFAPLPLATLERLTHDLIEIDVSAGVEVITQGDVGDRFHLIESGQVEVFEDGRSCRIEGVGESFGEIALLRGEPRTATVRAIEETRLLALERDAFITAVTGHGRSTQMADGVIAERLKRPLSDARAGHDA